MWGVGIEILGSRDGTFSMADRMLTMPGGSFALPRDAEKAVSAVNGALGLYVAHDDGPLVLTADIDADGLIRRIWIQMNPDKLAAQRIGSDLS